VRCSKLVDASSINRGTAGKSATLVNGHVPGTLITGRVGDNLQVRRTFHSGINKAKANYGIR
jgi:hypothetical protein